MRIDPCSVPVRKGAGYCYFWDDITVPDLLCSKCVVVLAWNGVSSMWIQ